ncbi:MAG: AMP-binding protein [Lachnospiraceae bacterium]|nr:AMP-binding protein [Lachnospiraceae bacterium]
MEDILWKDTLPWKVKEWGKQQPDKIAVASGSRGVTYAELNGMTESCRCGLREHGLKQGDYVVISAVMKAEYIAAFLAVKSLRMVAVPVNKTASETEVSGIINCTEASAFLTDNPKYQNIAQSMSLRQLCSAGKTADDMEYNAKTVVPGGEITEILFTSGTTGKPKGAMLSQRGIAASIYNTAEGMDMDHEDVLLLPLPLNHSFGLRVMRSALYRGETLVLQNGFSFARELQENVFQWNCNCMAAVNAGFGMLQQQMGGRYREVFSRMRYIEFSAGAVPAEKRKQLAQDLPGVRLYNTWGSTETGGGLFLEFSARTDKIQSAGKAIHDIQIKIVGNQGEKLAEGEYGRLALKGSALMKGYFKDPELTEEALRQGWLFTNDLARMDKDGYVYLNGRADDLISVGGEKVAPADVERIVLEQPGVKECACCGVEDPKGVLGQVPVLFLVPEGGGYQEKQLEEQIRAQGSGFMVPAAYVKLQELPRNYMGKLDRGQLKAVWEKCTRENSSCKTENSSDFSAKVLELIVSRRSVRAYQERPVEKELLDKLVLAGRMAPSGHNMQTWRFTVLTAQPAIARLKEIAEKVAAEKKTIIYGFLNPQAMILVSNDRRNPDGIQDSSAAIENILLMAHALGLGACWINVLRQISDEPEIRGILDQFEIPSTHLAYGLIGLGFPESTPEMPVKKENVVKFIEQWDV